MMQAVDDVMTCDTGRRCARAASMTGSTASVPCRCSI